jgi:hypothetical protein
MAPDRELDPFDPLGVGEQGAGSLPSYVAQDEPEVEVIDVVASVGPLDVIVVTLRDFLHRSGAVRAIALIPDADPEQPPSMIDCARLQPIEVTADGRTVHVPHAIPLDPEPLPLYDVKQLPPFEVDAEEGRIAAPLGGVEHYGYAVRSLAGALGDGAVALVTFTTTELEAPLSLTARVGDPIVLSLGDEEYEMAPGWPEELPEALPVE